MPPVTAPYQAEIEKYYQGEYWVNRYFINAASLTDAGLIAEQVYNAERTITNAPITFTKLSVRTTTKDDYVYQTVPLNTPGQNSGTSPLMPLFVVCRIDLTVNNSRPSRKYLRGVLREDLVTGMKIDDAMVSYVNTSYTNVLAGISGLVDPQNADIYGGSCSPITGMRQLRRGSKKKVTP